MNCKQARKLFRTNSAHGDEFRTHSAICDRCRKELAIEALTSALIKAHSSINLSDTETVDNPYLMARIRTRIRELSEHGVNSWESAILALRGWLIAFGAAAILLLTISVQWQLSNSSQPNDNDSELTQLSNISEDFLSGNVPSK
jgi:hypothetical protein